MINTHKTRPWTFVLMASLLWASSWPLELRAQEEVHRKPKREVRPQYPELARRMRLNGTVKIQVVIKPNGKVKSARVVGGHPLLVPAATDAAQGWEFEPASTETTQVLEFKFVSSEN